ncbi:MAG: protein translocase subunit SecD [Chthoniobacteraceae bacterium]|jgi:SecD/SecF fusion protein
MNSISLFDPILAAQTPASGGSNPMVTFFFGLSMLILFGWYFATDAGKRKRILGTVITVMMVVGCLVSLYPPLDVKDAAGQVIIPGKIHLGLDLQGGTAFTLRLDKPPSGTLDKDAVNQAIEVIRKRVDAFGTGEPVIAPEGEDRILVQIPGLDEAKISAAREQLQKVARLEFRLVMPNSPETIREIEAGEKPIPPGYEIKEESEPSPDGKGVSVTKYLVKRTADLNGEHVTAAHAVYSTQWEVELSFDSVGAQQFGDLTRQANEENTQLAILLDGTVICAPGVSQPGGIYGGSAQITGNYDETGARNLASELENPLRTPIHIEEERQASATLGSDSIKSGLYAGVAGLILVAVFMIIYYRTVGFIAIVALVINCIMVLGAMAMFNSVLTLPGIAGLILSLGIAIDANVLIYERLREELDAGKALQPAVDASYRKAFSAIFDAHVTQFLTAAILFWLANGPVQGFALTLTIGIVASMFSSLLITYTCFSWAFAVDALKSVTMLHLIRSKAFDFVGHAKQFVILSALLVAVSIGALVLRGNNSLGADFRGGDLLVLSSMQPLTPDQVRAALAGTPFSGSTIQEERTTDRDLISIRSDYGSGDKIKEQLNQKLASAGLHYEKMDHVGPLMGQELAVRSATALLLGLVGIYIYVTSRFQTSFAIGSIVALAHDLIITLGIFVLTGRELSLIMVGAILSIAGYSINDKIVVFDRIRSGLRDRHGGNTVAEIMNTSINETLSRTILTGGTALLTVLALYFFGGPVLNDFAFSFVIGIVIGTYSSIFIASPIVLWLSGGRGKKLGPAVNRTAQVAPV